MKLVSYIMLPLESDTPQVKLGVLSADDCVIDLQIAQSWAQGTQGFKAQIFPNSMLHILRDWENFEAHFQALLEVIPQQACLNLKGAGRQPVAHKRSDVVLLPPLPNVLSLRDFYGFEKHARNTYRLRSKAIPQAWYDVPVFYYANPFTIFGPDQAISMPSSGSALDFELEIACFIGKQGRDISPEEAPKHIAGYSILNDWSLRDVQMHEMRVGLGPAKGKDFATTLGPALVTPDELEDRRVGEGAELRYDLEMTARINNVEQSQGNLKDIHWTFSQMIARASRDVTLHPGEVIASGTVGTGCLLETGAEDTGDWLKPSDWVELEVERLGKLLTRIISPM